MWLIELFLLVLFRHMLHYSWNKTLYGVAHTDKIYFQTVLARLFREMTA